MRIYFKIIDRCNDCPNIGADINITRHECEAMKDKFLTWMVNDDHIDIPEWCPLPKELLTEKDMEIS